MPTLADKDKKALLALARHAITSDLMKKQPLSPPPPSSEAVKEKRGCFVTLHKQGDLRGCIGIIEPVHRLVDCVKSNACHAAFSDSRFSPVIAEELDEIDIEISVLTIPKEMAFATPKELKTKLIPHVHGVILSSGWHTATFLPQVWEQLPDPENFLSHLCRKAGMNGECWKNEDIQIKTYKVEYFSEQSDSTQKV